MHHTSHITHHKSYITHHTPHIIHHASHIIHHTSCITHHTSYITHHTSHITHHTSYITHHTSHITHHTSHNMPGLYKMRLCFVCCDAISNSLHHKPPYRLTTSPLIAPPQAPLSPHHKPHYRLTAAAIRRGKPIFVSSSAKCLSCKPASDTACGVCACVM